MAREIYEAFEGQQDAFGYSQATKVGDTIYVAGTPGVGEGFHIPESMAAQMELAYRNVATTLAHFGAVAWMRAASSGTLPRLSMPAQRPHVYAAIRVLGLSQISWRTSVAHHPPEDTSSGPAGVIQR